MDLFSEDRERLVRESPGALAKELIALFQQSRDGKSFGRALEIFKLWIPLLDALAPGEASAVKMAVYYAAKDAPEGKICELAALEELGISF